MTIRRNLLKPQMRPSKEAYNPFSNRYRLDDLAFWFPYDIQEPIARVGLIAQLYSHLWEIPIRVTQNRLLNLIWGGLHCPWRVSALGTHTPNALQAHWANELWPFFDGEFHAVEKTQGFHTLWDPNLRWYCHT